MKPFIIAIDGYSSCGKSTLAKALAKQLGFAYMDTGAMYRAVTLFLIRGKHQIEQLSEDELNRLLDQVHISFQFNPVRQESDTYLNGENVEEEIRGKEVSESVSWVSQIPIIRKRMVHLQQLAGKDKKLVIDGRDIGTVVFPKAELKLFMTADPDVRASRRFQELKAKGQEIDLAAVKENLKLRDHNDTTRKENPLRQAADAVVLDNTHLNQVEQLDWVMQVLKERELL